MGWIFGKLDTRSLGVLALITTLGCGSEDVEPKNGPDRVQLGDGALQGEVQGVCRRFLGIPYAKPPIGELRWKAPAKNEPWQGVRDATQFGGRCAQPGGPVAKPSANEDCLHLNVWGPEPAASEPLPVMVWFHGGSNVGGSTSDENALINGLTYDGCGLAADGGVLVVTVNYRLGALGFLPHEALRDEGSPVGNQALLDQRRALEWVQEHIGAFGGDPANVTIFGQSAGGRDVCFQLAMFGSDPLFHRAISQSGTWCTGDVAMPSYRVKTVAEAAPEVEAFVQAMGCGGAADELACLREKPAGELIANAPWDGESELPGGAELNAATPRWSFGHSGAVIDGELLRDSPEQLFSKGEIARVPLLIGANSDESNFGKLFGCCGLNSEADYLAALERRFGTHAAAVAAVYPVSSFDSPNDALLRLKTDWVFTCPIHDTARRVADAGLDVYLYNYDFPPPGMEVAGAFHGSELPSLLGGREKPSDEAIAVRQLVRGYWARFARSGDPNDAATLAWPKFRSDSDRRINLAPEPTIVDDFRAAECALWRTLYESAP
jgi:para-nitrobenzyl esterase